MRLAIVDDDKRMSDQIQEFLQRFREEQKIEVTEDVYDDPVRFVSAYSNQYDMILHDVEMPGMNGIETAKEIRKKDDQVLIMFLTVMAQFALQGYEVEAIDYVIKPIGYQDFAMKMRKALRYLSRDLERKIVLETQEGTVQIKLSEIYYIEIVDHYLCYYTDSKVYKTRGIMREQKAILQKYNFYNCSRSYLVNLRHVRAIHGNVVVVDRFELPLSRKQKKDFVQAFARYVGGI